MIATSLDCEGVYCDICNEDYTESTAVGGVLVGSYSLCPKCAREYRETPDDRAEEGKETFRDFVSRVRRGDTESPLYRR